MLARLNADLDSRTGPRSKRTPDLQPSENTADRIEKLMAGDGFRTWGLVIYRCTYKSDTDWNEFLRRVNFTVRRTLEEYNGLDMMDSYEPIVMEDKDFDGAITSAIRDHFKQWVVTACEREQGIPWKLAQNAKSPRYNFCIMVDEEALQSVLSTSAPDNPTGHAEINKTAYVKLVNRKWPGYLAEYVDEELAEIPDEDDHQEPIEGCKLEDVGWMKVLYDYVQLDATLGMHSTDDWRVQYYRPPEVGFQF
ncbi:hypothetical protein BDW74DRAFT_168904 [Aspergillus multicolor]|uniref:uncharacterized protein n=1 Tax=Aspergillus multicolor TaxID=41759 RepID=UPI003CCDA76B